MKTTTHLSVILPSGEHVPALGQGTWHMGENPSIRNQEIATIRLGLDLGLTLIDTAEMYGDGASEDLVGEAIEGRRDEVFLVSKVLPHHATYDGTFEACEASLRRLRTERLDLYLLHWRGPVPLEQTLEAFAGLVTADKIRYWGVSNFDLADMQDLIELPPGRNVTTDQVLYNLTRRGIEWDLLPWLRRHGIPVMAYSPVEQGRLMKHPGLLDFARRYGMTPSQVALAWVLSRDQVIAIPQTHRPEHMKQNAAAARIHLSQDQLAELDQLFPPPDGPRPLEMI